MGQIGYFGAERFEITSNSVFTPNNDFQRTTAARFETLDRIGLKSLTEKIAPGLQQITFSIKVSAMLGLNPRQVLDRWVDLAEAAIPDVLVIGNKPLGSDLWLLKSATDAWEKIDGQGNILTATLSLTFEEYVTS